MYIPLTQLYYPLLVSPNSVILLPLFSILGNTTLNFKRYSTYTLPNPLKPPASEQACELRVPVNTVIYAIIQRITQLNSF